MFTSLPSIPSVPAGWAFPPAPSGLGVTPASSSSLNLAWTDNASGEAGFKIERGVSAVGPFAQVGTAAANATSYNDTGLTSSTTYYYRVRAYNGSRNGAYSGVASGTTNSAGPPTVTPTRLLWLKSDTGLFTDLGTTPVSTDGDAVRQWNDAGGSGPNLTNSGGTVRPLYKTNQANGYPSVRFDGVNDRLNALFTANIPLHLFLVVRQITWVNAATLVGAGSGDNYSVEQASSSPNLDVWNGVFNWGTNNQLAVGSWGIFQNSQSSTAGKYFDAVNGNAHIEGPDGGNNHGGINLGSHANPSNYANVEFAEVLMYNAPLGSTDEASILAYLNGKYAIY